jgi:ketosteroid isomerase-like protein
MSVAHLKQQPAQDAKQIYGRQAVVRAGIADPVRPRPQFTFPIDVWIYVANRSTTPIMRTLTNLTLIVVLSLSTAINLNASPEEDAKAVAALDTKYQAAVKVNDATTMDQILADNFVLVTGRGSVFSKADLLDSARKKEVTYERQDEEPGTQKVRVWGDTAVVTALLWIKSVQGGKPADYKLWFSDTYVRTPTGWRYVFGQASLPLPKG